ncbi:circularly permuted type 2 ATP-grasp protein [Acaryochloris thomasi]|uniref:circularly permuted type 2 ATP-grasp protein n=1 Tax=Acaryochloris thomasi TaxID=2929456 RepID=UPI0018F14F1D|nr:circularly permuted type 2 ATP-grasp protein [Acaryochloris thomasi]
MLFDTYDPEQFYDEYFSAPGRPRPDMESIVQWLQQLSAGDLVQANARAEEVLAQLGATFTFDGEPRVLPFDVIPRVISATEWQRLSAGLKQRVAALNLFCADVYGKQQIINDGKIPRAVVESAERFLPDCIGMQPRNGVWCHVSGIDLICDRNGTWHVLEDNLRVPSGIAYVIKNREALTRVLPPPQSIGIEPIAHYPQQLRSTLLNLASDSSTAPNIAVLTPGPIESAYFEHAFLAEQMGVALVEPQDLVIADDSLHRRTPTGLQRIEILYRRRNADFFEPLDFGTRHASGLAAIIELCQQGRLIVANAFGTGVADDKVIYAYVPEMIRYYLGEDPLLPNVPTYLCWREQDRQYVLEHLDQLVIKPAGGEGGKGLLIGPHASSAGREEFAQLIKAQPRAYIAQPTIYLSRIPTAVNRTLEGRHVDLRPYVLHRGEDIYVHPGGLTRVALKKGSLVVNSTQGGGSKDTWVLSNS